MSEEQRAAPPPSSLNPDDVARRSFPPARKGLDPAAVRSFLEVVAQELRAGAQREQDLERRLSEAEKRAASPELDEGTLAAALGAETARVLQAAHEAAHQVVERAEARAAEILGDSERVLGERVAEGEAAARHIRDEARAVSAAMIDTAKADAERLVEATKAECRAMIGEARQVRGRVLRDLTERRRVLRLQVEQLLAGRGTLLGAVESVREAVDDLTGRLSRAEHEARGAADAAAAADIAEEAEDEADDAALERVQALGLQPAPATSPATDQPVDLAPELLGELGQGEMVVSGTAGTGPGGEVDFEGVTVLGVVPPVEPPGAGEPAAVQAGPHAGADAEREPEAGDVVEGAPPPIGGGRRRGRPAPAGEPVLAGVAPMPEPEGEEGGAAGASGAEVEADGEETVVSKVAVDELFAKIRASRAEQVAKAREILEADHAAAEARAHLDQPTASAEAVGAQDEQAEEGGGPVGPGDTDEVPVVVVEALARRDHLLSPVLSRLQRSLKRALQDDQNDLLDRLRKARSGASLDDLLPHGAQEDRYEAAARAGIESARRAGVDFALSDAQPGAAARPPGDGADEARLVARRLAEELVGALRLRIAGSLAAGEGDQDGADAVGAAYREWKGSRIAEIAGDHATRAFSDGQLAALRSGQGAGTKVSWVVDDHGAHCPDCDDNALAGPQAAGEPFPTGQLHPPVHAGCRCLLVTAPS